MKLMANGTRTISEPITAAIGPDAKAILLSLISMTFRATNENHVIIIATMITNTKISNADGCGRMSEYPKNNRIENSTYNSGMYFFTASLPGRSKCQPCQTLYFRIGDPQRIVQADMKSPRRRLDRARSVYSGTQALL
jgi:hypothetical protein